MHEINRIVVARTPVRPRSASRMFVETVVPPSVARWMTLEVPNCGAMLMQLR
jgi:hypothetical protein